MTGPLGKNQIYILAAMGSPGTAMVVGNKVTRSLQRRGLMAPLTPGEDVMLRITPAGLRVLADLYEACNFDGKWFGGAGK